MIKKCIIALCLSVFIIVSFVGVRTGLIWHGLKKNLLNMESLNSGLYVTPESIHKLSMTEKAAGSQISIGYADFAKSGNGTIQVSTEHDGWMVVIALDGLTLRLVSPSKGSSYEDWDVTDTSDGHLFGQEWLSQRVLGVDPSNPQAFSGIDVGLFCAQALPPSIRETIVMSDDQFTKCYVRLMIKALSASHLQRIVPFESEDWVGAVYMRSEEGKRFGHMDLVTRDREISQLIVFEFTNPSEENLEPFWEFLSTYSYVFDTCPTSEEVKDLVKHAIQS